MVDLKNKAYMDIMNYVQDHSLSNNVKVDKVVSGRVVLEYRGDIPINHKYELKNLLEAHNSIK